MKYYNLKYIYKDYKKIKTKIKKIEKALEKVKIKEMEKKYKNN